MEFAQVPRDTAAKRTFSSVLCLYVVTAKQISLKAVKCTQGTAEVGTIQLSARKERAKGPTLCPLFLRQWSGQPRFWSETEVDLNPGFATYHVIQNKLFSLGVFSLVTWGFHCLNSLVNFCYLEGLQMKPAS